MPAMPKLSEQLTRPRAPGVCGSCGEIELSPGSYAPARAEPAPVPHRRWRECDEFDRPTATVVVLCGLCSEKLIDPHPRLYHDILGFTPFPGTCPVCSDCPHRRGLDCTRAKLNGGPGVEMISPEPARVHIHRRGKGARSGWEEIYPGWPIDCSGKHEPEPAEGDTAE